MAYRSSTNNLTSTTTPFVDVPAGVAADDIIIMTITADNVGWIFSGKWPTGFNHLAEVGVTADGHKTGVAWKRATGADTGQYTCSVAQSGSADWVTTAFAFSGRDTVNPPTISANNTSNSANASPVTATANGLTALNGDDLLWVNAPDVTAATGASHTPPAGYTERQDVNTGGWVNMSGATKENVSAGATGTVSGTFTSPSSAGWAAWLVRVPAAPVTTLGITSLYQVGSSSPTTARVSSAFTPPANCILTVGAWEEPASAASNTMTIADSLGLIWTPAATAETATTGAEVRSWSTPIGASPASMTVTVSCNISAEIAYAVWAVTGTNPRVKPGQAVANAATVAGGGNNNSEILNSNVTSGNLVVYFQGINTDAFITPVTPAGWTNLAKLAAGSPTYEKVGVSYRSDFTGSSVIHASTGENLRYGNVLIEYEETPAAPGEFGYGEWLLEDDSGGWQLEDGSGIWLLDTTASAPVVPVARVRGPIISNVALNRSHTR